MAYLCMSCKRRIRASFGAGRLGAGLDRRSASAPLASDRKLPSQSSAPPRLLFASPPPPCAPPLRSLLFVSLGVVCLRECSSSFVAVYVCSCVCGRVGSCVDRAITTGSSARELSVCTSEKERQAVGRRTAGRVARQEREQIERLYLSRGLKA